jgi:xanthine dehydrogenase YagR molybdenum-binding subunit
MGPGTYTAMTQIAADAVGLPMHRVRFELGDTSMPKAQEHGGSTTTVSIGPAVSQACQALRDKINALAGDLTLDSTNIRNILQRAGLSELSADGDTKPGEEKEQFASYSFGAVLAEVCVDPDLGTVRVPRIVGAYDAGRIVNPALARSQCLGGMVGGLGMALLESTEWDSRLGRVANANLAEYLVPVCADVVDLDAIFIPGEDIILSPLGAKGLAELGLCGVAPAIANAVWHATGTRLRDMPITPDKLLGNT